MAPTICSEKKRETRTIANTDIRRHGQRSQLNQALSNIVNYVAKDSINPRVSASLRLQTHNQTEKNATGIQHSSNNGSSSNTYNHSTQTSATLAANHRRQHFSFISDNAVTSSTHSDTENSFDLRLNNEVSSLNDSSNYSSNATNPATSMPTTSTSSTSSSSQKDMSSTPSAASATSLCEERRFKNYSSSSIYGNNNDNDDYDSSAEVANVNEIHSKHYLQYNNADKMEEEEEHDCDSIYAGSDIDTDDSMTSLDTEKSAELKRGNNPLWRDKLLAKQQQNHNNNIRTKSLNNVRNTDGLLSIAIKTIKLVKRNQLLQQRLTQLQLETSEFIQSVLANPENRHFRENIKQNVKEVENV